MPDEAKLLLCAAIAVDIAYVDFFVMMTEGLALGQHSPMFIGIAVLGFPATVAAVILVQHWLSAPMSRALPDEREEAVDARSEQAVARVLEAGVLARVALATYEASAMPARLECGRG